jgi:transcriptional regulator with XRE-family HTH domain
MCENDGMTPLEFRQHKGWTLQQLSERLGYSPSYISILENGLRRINQDIVGRYERVSGGLVTYDDWVSIRPTPHHEGQCQEA